MEKIKKAIFREIKTNDCDLLFEWSNDKLVRENSFKSSEIMYDEHINWFDEKLKSNNTFMYIFEVDNEKVGLIRLDKLDTNSFIINYSISKEHRGKRYATALLKLIKDKNKSDILIGKVKPTNIASIKAFLKAGYTMKDEQDIKVFYSNKDFE